MTRLTLTNDQIEELIDALEQRAEERRYQAEYETGEDAEDCESAAAALEALALEIRCQQRSQQD